MPLWVWKSYSKYLLTLGNGIGIFLSVTSLWSALSAITVDFDQVHTKVNDSQTKCRVAIVTVSDSKVNTVEGLFCTSTSLCHEDHFWCVCVCLFWGGEGREQGGSWYRPIKIVWNLYCSLLKLYFYSKRRRVGVMWYGA